MALSIGVRLGPYEIVSALGAGGMGEVYRATDTNLKRQVAIKVLPESLSSDSERLARFQREAEVLASLNHPNIAGIHGLEKADGTIALVMELVEGEDLSQRVARGRIPLDEALPIARQIAEALEAAHEQGIIHRDLKPANIKLRDDGTVKVLDFGLAKLTEAPTRATGPQALSMSPTITSPAMMTGAGMLLGTAAYMSPEQAKGKPADKRSDIWAFGCVLYEMLTGKQAFDGDDVADVLVAILSKDPDWRALPASTPPALQRVLRRSLQRDRSHRLADMSDARLEIDEARLPEAPTSNARGEHGTGRKWLVTVLAAAVTAFVAGAAMWFVRPAARRPPITRFTIAVRTDQQFTNIGRSFMTISPDGSRVVYSARDPGRTTMGLYMRSLDKLDAAAIPGTEGMPAASAARVPFFSPDSRWLGFWQDGEIKKVSVLGGVPVTVTTSGIPMGASWGSDDTILYSMDREGIWRVPAAGGTPKQIVKLSPGQRAYGPQLLPGGHALLFSLLEAGDWNAAQIVVQSLDDGTRRVVVSGGADGRVVDTGHLVYAMRGTLLAVPFSLSTFSTQGGPIAVADGVAQSGGTTSGAAHFSISATGTLVYVPLEAIEASATNGRPVWVDTNGHVFPIDAPVRPYGTPALSPDGSRLAFEDAGGADIWTYEFRRGILERLTSDPARNREPVWSPDGHRIAYSSETDPSESGVFVRNADGTGGEERLTTGTHIPMSWSHDGQRLVYLDFNDSPITAVAPTDLGVVNLAGGRRAEKLVAAPGRQGIARISPNGQWLAYESNEPGETAIFVQPFPDVSKGRWRISNGPGSKPVWARDGRSLFYLDGDNMMAVAVIGSSPGEWGKPAKLFAGSYHPADAAGTTFDVAPDGRFLMIKAETNATLQAPDSMIVVQNWFEELKRLVPTK